MNNRRTFLTLLALSWFTTACALSGQSQADSSNARFDRARQRFVETRLRMITDERVKTAFSKVRREQYCIDANRERAYDDRPLPIGFGQTISQPSLVAYMTEALALKPGEKVLEIGTGSGFQAAMLAEMGARVFTIEIIDALAKRAASTLHAEGYGDVQIRAGDGYRGWPEEAPFDAIILTAAPEQVPQALLDQLRPNSGRLLVPEGPQGPGGQTLRLYRKALDGTITAEPLLAVRFVPMVREQN
jgi:protein-L-isoaspartate(D-aspartate) O-methyltransferase